MNDFEIKKVDWNCYYKGEFFIPYKETGLYYLHNDGIIRNSTSVNGEYKGYFKTKEDAEKAIELYKKLNS